MHKDLLPKTGTKDRKKTYLLFESLFVDFNQLLFKTRYSAIEQINNTILAVFLMDLISNKTFRFNSKALFTVNTQFLEYQVKELIISSAWS